MAPRLPVDAARMAWWLTSWLRGHASPDDVREAVLNGDAAHDVVGLSGRDELIPLILALGPLRASGAHSAGLTLAVPGDLVGLGGPPALTAAVLEVGEAVVLDGAGLALIPFRAGAGVVWQAASANRRSLDDLGAADRGLRRAIVEATQVLVDLDVASWRPEVADELMNLRHVPAYEAPPGIPAAAQSLAGRALQAVGIAELASVDDGNAVTSFEAIRRIDALRPLEYAARRALVAACSPEVWPDDSLAYSSRV